MQEPDGKKLDNLKDGDLIDGWVAVLGIVVLATCGCAKQTYRTVGHTLKAVPE